MSGRNTIREVVFFKDYFLDFYLEQRSEVRKKIDYVLGLLQEVPRLSEKFLKHIEQSEGLYELRIQAGTDIFRIFCFFDKGSLVVLANGFQKKTQRKNEIEKAERIRKEYFYEKE
jgi:phage-related protein